MNPPTLLLAVHKLLRKLQPAMAVEVSEEGDSFSFDDSFASNAPSDDHFASDAPFDDHFASSNAPFDDSFVSDAPINDHFASDTPPTDHFSSSDAQTFAEAIFPSLQRWLQYIEHTQQSALPGAFRWYGRTNDHCLASGIDDFPRPSPMSPREGHVDLLSWLAFGTKALRDLAVVAFGDGAVAQELAQKSNSLRECLDDYWDETAGFFGDIGEKSGVSSVETHVGYVGLLPLALELLETDDPRLAKLLDAIEDPERVGKRGN